MAAGYGRGYYGADQLERPRRRRNWFTVVAVLGLGATAVWLLWPRKAAYDLGPPAPTPLPPSPPLSFPTPTSIPPVQSSQSNETAMTIAPQQAIGAFHKQLEDDARASGFLEVKDYEDSVVAIAKQLQTTGTKVMLAPHLQHLVPRLGS